MVVLLNASANPLAVGLYVVEATFFMWYLSQNRKKLAYKMGTIIVDDPSGNTKSVDDMVFDEVNYVNGFNFGERHGFCPF